MATDVRALLDRYLTTFRSGDTAAVAALHSPGSTYWLRLDRAPVIGRDDIEAEFVSLFRQYPEMDFEVRDVRLGDSFWVLDWVLSYQGARGRVEFDCLDVVDVDADGLVSRKVTYLDLAQAQARMLADARDGDG